MQIRRNSQILSYQDKTFRVNLNLLELPLIADAALQRAEDCRRMVRKLCESAFTNLNEFPYIYFTAGVTEGIDHLVPRQKTAVLKNEYRYVRGFSSVIDVGADGDQDTFFFTFPFSGSGRFETIPVKKNIILDCSYFFASNMRHVEALPGAVRYVLFGLSKSHNLSDARIGWMFSKYKIITYHTLQYEYGYIGGLIHPVLKRVLDSVPNKFYLKYKDQLSELYKKHSLIEVDTNLFALTDAGERVPYYLLK